jgi:S1-C subfamily serine protease
VFRPTFARLFLHTTLMAVLLTGLLCAQPAANAAGKSLTPAREKRMTPPNAAPVDFPSIVERYGPAVVNISASAPDQPSSMTAPEAIDANDPFLAFFERFTSQSQISSQARSPRALSGSGSGFIVSPDGMILTAAHVVGHADEVTVRLTDRREFKGKVLVVDAQSGVALVHIDADKLPTVKLGDSSRVRTGEPVLAIGSPDGFDNTVTAGVVSATVGTLPDGSAFPFFQTDVSGNPDNSGGPLMNHAAEVIGINVQLYADTDRYSILTFAIPINLASKVRSQLQAKSTQSTEGLGLVVEDVGSGMAVALGLPKATGALVDAVEPGTPAARSGLKPGDVIVQIGKKKIERSAELLDSAAAFPPGTKTALRLIRNRKPMTTAMTIGQPVEQYDNSGSGGSIGSTGNSGSSGNSNALVTPVPTARVTRVTPLDENTPTDRLGLILHPLSEQERRNTGLAVGLMVDDVFEPAASAGIRRGDVVLSLGDTLVETQAQVSELAAKARKQVAVLIQRQNARSFVSIKLR